MKYKSPKTMALGALTILVLVFVLQNDHRVGVTFLFWSLEFPLFLLLFAMMVLGFAWGWLLGEWRKRRASE